MSSRHFDPGLFLGSGRIGCCVHNPWLILFVDFCSQADFGFEGCILCMYRAAQGQGLWFRVETEGPRFWDGRIFGGVVFEIPFFELV